ncbi:MAG: hypothetical protein ACR2J6_05355 [Thermoleophilaceae bacterium]
MLAPGGRAGPYSPARSPFCPGRVARTERRGAGVELDALRPPAARLTTETYRRLRAVLRQALTEEGWTLCNVDAVELLALGYAAGAELDRKGSERSTGARGDPRAGA